MAQAEAVVARAERRQPGGYLTTAPLGEILAALGDRGREILQQKTKRLTAHRDRERFALWRIESLDGVVQRLDAGRGPQLLGGCQRELRVQDDELRRQAGMRVATLEAGLLVGDAGAASELRC